MRRSKPSFLKSPLGETTVCDYLPISFFAEGAPAKGRGGGPRGFYTVPNTGAGWILVKGMNTAWVSGARLGLQGLGHHFSRAPLRWEEGAPPPF